MREQILKILTDCKAEIINNMQSEGVTVTGRTANSLTVEDRGDHLVLVQKPEEGAPIETTQFGRPAGKVPQGFRQIIKQWITDRKIPTQPYHISAHHRPTGNRCIHQRKEGLQPQLGR